MPTTKASSAFSASVGIFGNGQIKLFFHRERVIVTPSNDDELLIGKQFEEITFSARESDEPIYLRGK